ncbi:tyrosine-type recombinase/integrase [Burkholderia vietnamiensis]|uniref:tyrosine-type recombinase/integrase n=1 Tax=Burkholderia vietnamiensis TaxID=60552 RepID=UPI000755ED26|nr:site-specific integrase [Burkholderia vietnamiensis]KVS00446.1 integrase [Burkholderia vietnamiensis]KVS38908.1 integrase [Burkholderia vietnamiensis]MCA7986537.1 tyrosine-type recombinase/integrase [Burkholderia vietnamiensis]HDR8931583.1 tyrosine-type recombinase/integrase [Burkholderia vietnamiensis]
MAKRQTNLLTDVELKQFIRARVPLAKSDGAGLTFTLSAAGTASWILRFSHGGRRHELTLGTYPDLPLTAARKLAASKRVEVQQGVNPAVERRKEKARKDWSVRQLIADYEERILPTLAESTQRSYGRNLKRVLSGMGSLSLHDVSAADIVAQIERVSAGWVELFTLWCVLKAIFKHAAGKRLVDANPCAGIVLESVIGKRPEVKKRLMLTAEEIHVLMNAKMKDENLLSVRVLLATGVRASELFTAKRKDVFLDEARWHIPKSKTGPEMDIPLAPVVVDWFRHLAAMAGQSGYVLPARLRTRFERLDGDTHISKDAIREAIDFWIEHHKPEIRRFTPHDLRSTMKSHMRALGVSRDISEMCLNHKLAGVEGIYDKHTYYDERRAALELWARFITTCQAGEKWNVTPMKRSA